MKFFEFFEHRLRHFSTSRKIIDIIEKSINLQLRNEPEIQSDANQSASFSLSLKNKGKLAIILGKTMQQELSDPVYDKYQKLTDNQKDKIRQRIADTYFEEIKKIQVLKDLKRKKDTYYIDTVPSINLIYVLPEIFMDQTKLAGLLKKVLAATKLELSNSKESSHINKSDPIPAILRT